MSWKLLCVPFHSMPRLDSINASQSAHAVKSCRRRERRVRRWITYRFRKSRKMHSRLQGRLRSLMRKKYSNARRRRPRKMVRFEMRSKAQILRECGLPLCGIANCRVPECNIPRCGLLTCKLPECVLSESDLAEFLLPNCGQARCKLPLCHVRPSPEVRKGRDRNNKEQSGDKWSSCSRRGTGKSGQLPRKSARLVAKKQRKSARLFEKRRRKRWSGELEDEDEHQTGRKSRRSREIGESADNFVRDRWGSDRTDDATTPPSARMVEGCTSCKLCRRTAYCAPQGVVHRLTDLGEENLLLLVLEKLPPGSLLQAARVCRSWARQCEIVFKRECQQNGWALPRHPRWSTTAFPWRSLYFRHACRVCGRVGEFFVRKRLNGNFQFLLCGTCIRQPSVKERLVQYSIDLYGVSGKLVVRSLSMSKTRKMQSFL